jgi:hypothetical protein
MSLHVRLSALMVIGEKCGWILGPGLSSLKRMGTFLVESYIH